MTLSSASRVSAIYHLDKEKQEKHLGKHKPLYFAFVYLEKAFDHVSMKFAWWAMRRVGVEEWVKHTVKSIYENAKSCVRLNGHFSDQFNIKVGVKVGCP